MKTTNERRPRGQGKEEREVNGHMGDEELGRRRARGCKQKRTHEVCLYS